MDNVFTLLGEAAQIRADMAKQEMAFWEKVSEALDGINENRNNFHQERNNASTQPAQRTSKKSGYLTVREAADYLGISEASLNGWRTRGDGPKFAKIGRMVRYRAEDLDAYVTENTFPHTSAYGLKR